MNIDIHAMPTENKDDDNDWYSARLDFSPEQMEILNAKVAKEKLEVMEYLEAKFPDVEKEVFRTDYTGYMHEEVINWPDVYKAAIIDRACANCKGSNCEISESLGVDGGRPVPCVETSPKGFKYPYVRWTCGLSCKFRLLSGEFGQRFKESGLCDWQIRQTFDTYICTTPENRNAKTKALAATKEGAWLLVLGEPWVGKTHLATAIAIEVMKGGKQVIYRTVMDFMDEFMQKDNDDDEDFLEYLRLKDKMTSVDCLVLDGLQEGVSNKDRGMSYLYEVISKRDVYNLQTIITANATNLQEMESWGSRGYVPGIVSRTVGRGNYVLLRRELGFDGAYSNV